MTAAAMVVVAAMVVTLVPRAYRRGCGVGGPRLPVALVAELRAHKVVCLGEPAARVALELGLPSGDDAMLNAQETAARRA